MYTNSQQLIYLSLIESERKKKSDFRYNHIDQCQNSNRPQNYVSRFYFVTVNTLFILRQRPKEIISEYNVMKIN